MHVTSEEPAFWWREYFIRAPNTWSRTLADPRYCILGSIWMTTTTTTTATTENEAHCCGWHPCAARSSQRVHWSSMWVNSAVCAIKKIHVWAIANSLKACLGPSHMFVCILTATVKSISITSLEGLTWASKQNNSGFLYALFVRRGLFGRGCGHNGKWQVVGLTSRQMLSLSAKLGIFP